MTRTWHGHLAVIATGMLIGASCATRRLVPTAAHTSAFTADVTDEEWSTARPFDKSTMTPTRLLAGSHQPNSGSVLLGQMAYAKVDTIIRKDGSVGVYRILETNNAAFANDVAAMLRKQTYEAPVFRGESMAIRVESYYRVVRDQ